MIDIALVIVQKAFDGKTDKAGEPYIEHLKRVKDKCADRGIDHEVKTVALLHDLLEDCPEWNEKVLRTFFPDSVVDSVVSLTHKPGESYNDYISRVIKDEWACIVKKADLEDNMDVTRLKSLTKEDFERLKKYHGAYIRIVEAIEPM